jgi:2-hydroxychromene-2-carboxylate isomerase
MPRTIKYYFSMLSPWAYIGQATFNEIVARHKAKVVYKPVFLPDLVWCWRSATRCASPTACWNCSAGARSAG